MLRKADFDSDSDSDSDSEAESLFERSRKRLRRDNLEGLRRHTESSLVFYSEDWVYNNVTLWKMYPPETREAKQLHDLRITYVGEPLLRGFAGVPADVGLIIAEYFNSDVLTMHQIQQYASTHFYELQTRPTEEESKLFWTKAIQDSRPSILLPGLLAADARACQVIARVAAFCKSHLKFHRKYAWAGRYAHRWYLYADVEQPTLALVEYQFRRKIRGWVTGKPVHLEFKEECAIRRYGSLPEAHYNWNLCQLTSEDYSFQMIQGNPLLYYTWTWLDENLLTRKPRLSHIPHDVEFTLNYLERFL